MAEVWREPGLRRGLLASLVLSLLLAIVVFVGGLWGAFAGVDLILSGDGWVARVAGVALKVLLVGLFVLIAPVLYALGASALDPVFLPRASRSGAGTAPEARGVAGEVAVTARAAGWELRRLGRFVALSLPLALLALIPVVGLVALPLQLALSAHTLAWQCLSTRFEDQATAYRDQRACLRHHRLAVLAFGGVSLALLLIPLAQPWVLHGMHAGAGRLSRDVGRERPPSR